MSNRRDAGGARHGGLTRSMLACAMFLLPLTAGAQITLRPAAKPLVTAATEPWYVAGEALTFYGALYFPTGAQVFFDANEMARSGSYRGIPLFSLTTREPFSVLYVPVGGGLMQPYERVRAGEVAGTFGTSDPSAPLQRDAEGAWDGSLDAQGASLRRQWAPAWEEDEAIRPRARALGAIGGSNWPEPRGPLTTALTPTGLNAFYIEHQGQRWFASGKAVLLDPAAFTPAGEYRGFPVYVARGGQPGIIYVSVAGATDGLATPYSLHR